MLWIDEARLDPPARWSMRSSEAAQALAALDVSQRSVMLRRGGAVWGIVRATMLNASAGKCWYCDSRQDRSYMAIDHYRPKGELAGVRTPHEGYWWLAYELDNFRLACINCNSPSRTTEGEVRGKQNYFPLLDESARAYMPTDALSAELPLILDPRISTDAALLFFDVDGYARPNPRLCPEGSIKLRRVEATIDILNLNQPGIRDRRKRIARRVAREHRRASLAFDGFVAEDVTQVQSFVEACEALKELIAEIADLASNARCFLRAHRDTTGVAAEILNVVL